MDASPHLTKFTRSRNLAGLQRERHLGLEVRAPPLATLSGAEHKTELEGERVAGWLACPQHLGARARRR